MLIPYLDHRPVLAGTPHFGEHAIAIGRTAAGEGLRLCDYATLRGDGESITIGRNVFFGERATVHIADSLIPSVIGDDVTVGRFALVHACTLQDGVVLGDGAVVMDGAVVGAGAVIGAGTLISPRKELAGGYLYAGNPAVQVRPVSAEEVRELARSVRAGTPNDVVSDSGVPGAHSIASTVPQLLAARSFVATTAALGGEIQLADDSSVYYGCVLDARGGRIVVGRASNVQDNSILTTAGSGSDLIIGERVTVGHNVRLGAAMIEDDALVGMGSEVGDGVVVERGGCIAARAQVRPGTVVKAGWIWAGRPARAFRALKEGEREWFARGVQVYVGYGATYRGGPGARQDL